VLMRMSPKVVSARELTRLMAGLTREEARRPAPKTPEEKQRGESMHPQDYPRDRPAFRRDGDANTGGNANNTVGGSTSGGGFKMRNRIRGRGR
jgi:ribosomal-protein-alanine N-acetyltransferase